jgi:hypothetical protein
MHVQIFVFHPDLILEIVLDIARSVCPRNITKFVLYLNSNPILTWNFNPSFSAHLLGCELFFLVCVYNLFLRGSVGVKSYLSPLVTGNRRKESRKEKKNVLFAERQINTGNQIKLLPSIR